METVIITRASNAKSLKHDYIHIFYISTSLIFYLIEVFLRITIDLLYKSEKDAQINLMLALNRYQTELTPSRLTVTVTWYFVLLWQAVWMIYSIVGIFRRTPSGHRFYRSPSVMNKWCFFYTTISLILYTSQMTSALRNRYRVKFSIFRYMTSFLEVLTACVVVHYSLKKKINKFVQQRLIADIWLTRLLYHNGIALWASLLFYETCLSIVVALVGYDRGSTSFACLIGGSILLTGILLYSIFENLIFYHSLSFTFSPWLVFLCFVADINFREHDENSSSMIVLWLIHLIFCLICILIVIRLILFLWRYKYKLIPTFQSPKVFSLVDEPHPF